MNIFMFALNRYWMILMVVIGYFLIFLNFYYSCAANQKQDMPAVEDDEPIPF